VKAKAFINAHLLAEFKVRLQQAQPHWVVTEQFKSANVGIFIAVRDAIRNVRKRECIQADEEDVII
jgi:hypothetical protein